MFWGMFLYGPKVPRRLTPLCGFLVSSAKTGYGDAPDASKRRSANEMEQVKTEQDRRGG
ncbi:unnamed protein product [Periconia digitata]|uniref:Uncharacterized protein n=1 Tax=Periconia digitata TaxID=1303443 RepID=A0A9W4XY34_9PLEO|nr:unnamed protein product [Periconia digitata]